MSNNDSKRATDALRQLDDQPEIVIDTAETGETPKVARRIISRVERCLRRADVDIKNAALTVDKNDGTESAEMARRAGDALNSARESIISGMNANSNRRETKRVAQPQKSDAEARPNFIHHAAVDRWQSSDNIFNIISRRIHSRLTSTGRYLTSSISTRISLSYVRVLWKATIAVILLSVIAVAFAENTAVSRLSRDVCAQIENYLNEGGTGELDIELRTVEDAYSSVSNASEMLYNDIPFDAGYRNIVRYDGQIYRIDAALYMCGGRTYQVYIALSMRYWLRMELIIIAALVVFMLSLSLYLTMNGRRLNAQMIEPILEISDAARHLGAENMSQRLNVEGMRSELRELAMVINDMLDRIEKSYNAQKQFVSDASHELRTPIAVIEGYANMLKRWGNDDPAVRDEASDAIVREAANMKELVEKLLFLARNDNGTLSIKSDIVDMCEIAQEVVGETRMIISDRQIVEGKMEPVRVIGDPSALKQAIRIFVDNACKYTPAGGTVSVSCRHGGEGCLVSVADTGCGIPSSDLNRVFDRFYRVDSSRGEIPGHGLGLSIARIIAVNHGGKIHVRSKEGVGSVFTLDLPGYVAE